MPTRSVVPVDPDLLKAIDGKSTWSDAVVVDDFVWVCGQIGWDKKTGEFVEGIEAQTELALENLKLVVEKAGSSLENVITTHVYLTNVDQYRTVDAIYARYFPKDPPARVTVVVKDLIDHGTCVIDIEALALRNPG